MSKLTDRLREIVRTPAGAGHPAGATAPAPAPVPGPSSRGDVIQTTLAGQWLGEGRARCFGVEHRWPADARCGAQRVGDIAGRLQLAAGRAAMLTPGGQPPFVFFDLETTGLSGGAGTHAFLVGFGLVEADGSFATRQYVLASYADERPLLEVAAREIDRAGALVSFNGKSFDAPVLETRYLFHRLEWPGRGLPHVDVLHPARRFWGAPEASCSLTALEAQVLGARRAGDVPGFEIPSRYFQFVRSGDPGPLRAVLEHNRLDLLSLAGLTARILHLLDTGAGEAIDAREALALGRVYARADELDRARAAFERALQICREPLMRVEILRNLAVLERRRRGHEAAAGWWRAILEVRGCPPQVVREATEALAIHHEHRARDLAKARLFALQSMGAAAGRAWSRSLRHRLTRIERKLSATEPRGAMFDLMD